MSARASAEVSTAVAGELTTRGRMRSVPCAAGRRTVAALKVLCSAPQLVSTGSVAVSGAAAVGPVMVADVAVLQAWAVGRPFEVAGLRGAGGGAAVGLTAFLVGGLRKVARLHADPVGVGLVHAADGDAVVVAAQAGSVLMAWADLVASEVRLLAACATSVIAACAE